MLGAVWASVGAVLLALARLAAGGASLPDWVSRGVAGGGSSPLTALVGLLVVAAGAGQVLAGVHAARGRARPWAIVTGLLLAAVGAGVCAVWLFAGIAQQRPAWILLPPLAAYLYAGWALAFRTNWAQRN
ncbi:MAG TPA: hypothetical protein VF071_03125 [Candidatus Limnocylindria bacterium]